MEAELLKYRCTKTLQGKNRWNVSDSSWSCSFFVVGAHSGIPSTCRYLTSLWVTQVAALVETIHVLKKVLIVPFSGFELILTVWTFMVSNAYFWSDGFKPIFPMKFFNFAGIDPNDNWESNGVNVLHSDNFKPEVGVFLKLINLFYLDTMVTSNNHVIIRRRFLVSLSSAVHTS